MNTLLREMLTHQHDQARIRHNQRIGLHFDHGLNVFDKGFQFGVMRSNVNHHIKLLTLRMRFFDTQRKVVVVKLIIAHAQTISRLTGIHRISTIGKSITHIFQRAGRAQ